MYFTCSITSKAQFIKIMLIFWQKNIYAIAGTSNIQKEFKSNGFVLHLSAFAVQEAYEISISSDNTLLLLPLNCHCALI